MYAVGDCVFYGTKGVCRVTEIGPSPFDKTDQRLFYVLKPVLTSSGDATIYTPVDGTAAKMRSLITRERAAALLNAPREIGCLIIRMEKQRRDMYQEAMLSSDPVELMKILNTVRLRRATAAESHKHLPNLDMEYEGRAKRCLLSEFSVVLGIAPAEVEAILFGHAEGF